MQNRKGRFVTIALAALCVILVVSGTWAYFTDVSEEANVITSGNIDIEIRETAEAEDGSIVPYEDSIDVTPGQRVSKIVQIANNGDSDAFVRISVETVFILSDGRQVSGDDVVSFDFDTKNWTFKDGFYYYNKPLKTGKLEEPLFTAVTFNGDLGNDYLNSRAEVRVHAEAVQARNNDANGPLGAKGWPSE